VTATRDVRHGSALDDAAGHPGSRGAFVRTWALFAAVLTAVTVTWSLVTPLPSGPDEPTQYVKAAAVASGNLIGGLLPGGPHFVTRVGVPGPIADIDGGSGCYYGDRNRGAGCAANRRRVVPTGTVSTTTYVGRYPPLYYAVTGLPSLLSSARPALYAMRAVSALMGSLVLGLAFATAWRWSRGRFAVVGLALAVTPEAIYLMSVLNPNGFEIAAAAALWTSATILVCEHSDQPPPALVGVVVVAALLLAATRPLSPLWVLVVLAALAVLRPRAMVRLSRASSVRWGAVALGVGGLLASGYVLHERSYGVEAFRLAPGTTDAQIGRLLLLKMPGYFKGLFGEYGSPDTPAPYLVLVVLGCALAVLVGAALLLACRYDASVLALLVVGFLIVLPLGASVVSARSNGLVWQGRYEYPLALGIPIVAAVLLGERRLQHGRAAVWATAAVCLGLFMSFLWVFHRYSVGLAGPLDPLTTAPGSWRPPVPARLLLPLALVATVSYGALLLKSCRPNPVPGSAPRRTTLRKRT